MDWKQFTIGLVSHLSWPLVALLALLMFRIELMKVIQRLDRFKYKDLELDFEKLKQQAAGLHLDVTKGPEEKESPVLSSLEDQLFHAVENAPLIAISLAWSGVESAIADAVSRLAISPDSPSYRSPAHNIDMLVKSGNLSEIRAAFLQDMRMLRNKVAHDLNYEIPISRDQAKYYATAAIEFIQFFNSLRRAA